MVVNFQSWLDPFIILTALPGLFTGILWMLFATQTTISVPSLMGAIMSIGVATANSILMVTFANDERLNGSSAMEAALSAGYTRLRPVVMTAIAMIIGMLPISLGLGEGGEQNAPLGRAVIGGLLMATVATLFFVPVMYTILRKKPPLDLATPRIAAEGTRWITQSTFWDRRGRVRDTTLRCCLLGCCCGPVWVGFRPWRDRQTRIVTAAANREKLVVDGCQGGPCGGDVRDRVAGCAGAGDGITGIRAE